MDAVGLKREMSQGLQNYRNKSEDTHALFTGTILGNLENLRGGESIGLVRTKVGVILGT